MELPRRNRETAALTELKLRLLRDSLRHEMGEPLARMLQLAALEAEAQAWLTSYPLLTFPELFEEKAREAKDYVDRQERVRRFQSVRVTTAA